MRVTTLQTNQTMLDYITNSQSKYNELAQEASSGIKVTKPSDDPCGTKTILNINSTLNSLNGYLTNMTSAQSELNTTDSTFASLTTLISNASDYATQGANGTYNSNDLATLKTQVDSIIQSVVGLANTNFNGSYIFSGTATSTQPYTIATDASGAITSVTYNGTTSSEYQRYAQISDGVSVAINVKGSDIFGSYTASTTGSPSTPASGSGLLYTLGTLSEALASGDTTTINAKITNLNNNLDTVTAARTKLAAVSTRFDMTKSTIDETITNLKSYRSDIQDADLAEVMTNLATAQSALEATYLVTSKMLAGKSLLDYI